MSSAYFSVLVNGSFYGFFPSTQGIRQGDPLSPALFTILLDLLSRILSRAEHEGKISSVKTAQTAPRVSHLMYADDLVIYCKIDLEETIEIKNCLDLYCKWTGQRINWDKSDIHFSPNVPRATQHEICRRLGMRECAHTGKYLDSPFCNFHHKASTFNYIAEKLANKLIGWKSRHLSMVGQTTLIKSVGLAIPAYVMQTFLLPTQICMTLDKLVHRFLWGAHNDKDRYLSLRAWDNICTPKHVGGLGIRHARDMNVAYITKLGWKVCTEPTKLWVKLI